MRRPEAPRALSARELGEPGYSAPLNALAILRLQRAAGNAAVCQLNNRAAEVTPAYSLAADSQLTAGSTEKPIHHGHQEVMVQRDEEDSDLGSSLLGGISSLASGIRDKAEDFASQATEAIGAAENVAVETASGAVNDVKNLANKSDTNGQDGPSADLGPAVRAELVAQINGLGAGTGIIGELNDLDNFKETDVVPDVVQSFAGQSRDSLERQIKEKEFTIAQQEATRINIAKKTRADARLATENMKRDMTAAVLAPGVSVPFIILATKGVASPGGSLALLGAMCAALLAEHTILSKYRDTLRLSVDKAKGDMRIINTTIAFENKKLAAMRDALNNAPTVPVIDVPEQVITNDDAP